MSSSVFGLRLGNHDLIRSGLDPVGQKCSKLSSTGHHRETRRNISARVNSHPFLYINRIGWRVVRG